MPPDPDDGALGASGGYIPHRLRLLERFGAALYIYLFRRAQGHEPSPDRVRAAGRAYLAAGGTDKGLRQTIDHVEQQTRPILAAWYDEPPGSIADAVLAVVGTR